MTGRWFLAAALAGAAMSLPSAAPAQVAGELASAKRAGQIGERYDGYLGFAGSPTSAARAQASAINIRRRALYIGLATRRGVTPQDASIATGCELLKQVAVGEAYMLADGTWRRRAVGQPVPAPDYCM